MKKSVEDLTTFLQSQGIKVIKIVDEERVFCREFQYFFYIIYCKDFCGMRWQCNLAYLDLKLRQWQNKSEEEK